MVHFGWEYVGTLAVDDAYGRNGRAQFVSEAQQRRVCIAFQEDWNQIILPEDIKRFGEKALWFLNNVSIENIQQMTHTFILLEPHTYSLRPKYANEKKKQVAVHSKYTAPMPNK